MRFRRKTIVLDAADLEPVSAFWARLLDGRVDRDDDWHAVLVDDAPYLAVQLAPDHERPQWPGTDGQQQQQIHLDLHVDDLATAHEQAVAAGATLVQPAENPTAGEGFQVYADPAGHPFCLCWG